MRVDPYEALAEYLRLQLGVAPLVRARARQPRLPPADGRRARLARADHAREGVAPRAAARAGGRPALRPHRRRRARDGPRAHLPRRAARGPGGGARRAAPAPRRRRRGDARRTRRRRCSCRSRSPRSCRRARPPSSCARVRDGLGVPVDRVVVNAVPAPPFPAALPDLDARLAALPAGPRRCPARRPPAALARCAAHLRARSRARPRVPRRGSRSGPGSRSCTLPWLPGGVRGEAELDGARAALLAPEARREPRAPPHATPERGAPRRRRIVVCLGCGGVGKTTVSAALALLGARLGRRVLVLTIDPARRLADALGLDGHGPRAAARSRPRLLARLGVPPEGELSAAMLDMKTHLRRARRALRAQRGGARAHPRATRSTSTSPTPSPGSAEYSAMEKVYQLSESKDLDLIVLDTPPAQHALDFLEAPRAPARLPREPARAPDAASRPSPRGAPASGCSSAAPRAC